MIVGFSLQHIEADRKQSKQGNMNINYASDVTDIEEADIAAFDETVARIHFTFTITYRQQEDDMAEINFEGTVLWQQNADQLIEQWGEEQKIDEAISATVTNHIFRKCLTQAVTMADSLELPSPVPMPQVGQ